MKITCLLENTTQNAELTAEHGLSLYIETEESKILFDMGQSEAFLSNAEKLAVDLSQVDFAILSHGHYDHGGGLKAFLDINKTAPVYVSRHAFGAHYNGTEKYIGLDVSLRNSDRLIFVGDEFLITENARLLSCNGMPRAHGLGAFGLTIKENGIFKPDPFLHEQYLLLEENGKKVLISGCSHKGIMDIVSCFAPDVLIGGFHFSKIEDEKTLDNAVSILNGFETQYYTCHCTGLQQYEYMQRQMPNLQYLSCGQTLVI